MDEKEACRFLRCLLELGDQLLGCGAEISRVEDTLSRMGTAYGAERMDVFVITSSIVLTLQFPDGLARTETRRIRSAGGTDFTRLERLNELSRRCCAAPLPVGELEQALEEIGAESKPFAAVVLGSILSAGAFTVFFGGKLPDGIAAAVFGLAICLLQRRLGSTELEVAPLNLLISFLIGLGVSLLARLVPGLHADKILIGDIMLLIPGIAMTNAVRNMLTGNTISGVMRLTESLVWTAALACGFMVSFWLVALV